MVGKELSAHVDSSYWRNQNQFSFPLIFYNRSYNENKKFEKHTRVVNSAAMDEGHDVSEAEPAVDDEAARLLGVLQPVLVARQVGGRRSEDALESGYAI